MRFFLRNAKQACMVIGIVSLIALSCLVTGCTPSAQPGTASALDSPVLSPCPASPATPSNCLCKMDTFTRKDNGTAQMIRFGSPFAIKLHENPLFGPTWNVSTTAGLEILSTHYDAIECPQPVGVCGGERTWILKLTEPGKSSFTGVGYSPFGFNETYSLTLIAAIPIPVRSEEIPV